MSDVRAVEYATQAGLCDLFTSISLLTLLSLVNVDADMRVAIMNGTRDLRHIMSRLVQGKERALWDGHMIYDKLGTRNQVATMLPANGISKVCAALSDLITDLTRCQNRTIDVGPECMTYVFGSFFLTRFGKAKFALASAYQS